MGSLSAKNASEKFSRLGTFKRKVLFVKIGNDVHTTTSGI
jgi:hypothetical protein